MIKNLEWYSSKSTGFEQPVKESKLFHDFTEYKDFILDRITFTKILKKFKLRPDGCAAGKYTHRMVCPFVFHKGGNERTGSFRIDDKNNRFCCFGCTETGDILKFLQIYKGGNDTVWLYKLAGYAGLLSAEGIDLPEDYQAPEPEAPQETNYRIKFEAGLLLRQYLLEIPTGASYKDECEWADEQLAKIDKYFALIEDTNMEDAQNIHNNLSNAIKRRKKKSSGSE